jgi:glycosyltransferase involved in cell wall biosynthesis
MRILLVTNIYPTAARPTHGVYVAEQAQSLISRGHEIDVLHLRRFGQRARYVSGIVEIARARRRFLPDLIHAHYGLTGAIAVFQPAPVVVTYHGSDVMVDWQRRISRIAARRASANVVVSERQRTLLDVPRTQVIPCGVDPELFRPYPREKARARLHLDPAERWILFAGAFDNPVKNFALLETALAESPGLTVRVKEMAGIARSDVPWWMAAADVLVLTSHSEGSPMVVKEALFCGLPVIATPVGDVPERIGAIAGCRVVDPSPPAVRASVDDALARRERLDLPQEVLAELRLDRIAERIESVYREVLRSHR